MSKDHGQKQQETRPGRVQALEARLRCLENSVRTLAGILRQDAEATDWETQLEIIAWAKSAHAQLGGPGLTEEEVHDAEAP